MFRFNLSKRMFFSKDGEADNGNITTFFDSLNLETKNGGGSKAKPVNKFADDKEEETDELEDVEESEDEDEDLDDESDDDSNDESSKLSPELKAIQEQLKLAQEQNVALMKMLNKKEFDNETPPVELQNPFETEDFDNLAETMDWDDSERKAMKAFMQNALNYQKQVTLSSATENITDIVNSSMSQAEKKRAVRKQFFKENPALEPVTDYVSTVAAGVLKEYKAAGKSLDPAEILKEAAARSYKVLGIKPGTKGNNDSKSERDSNPAFPSTKGSSKKRNQKVEQTRNQKMITSMIDL